VRAAGGEAVVISRSGDNNYENLEKHADAAYLINTTPVGMYPHTDASPVDLKRLPHLRGVLVYVTMNVEILPGELDRALSLARKAWEAGADALIVQAIGAALIEKLMDSVEDEIRAELTDGETLVSRYSPGYGDFPLAAQSTVLALLDAPRTVGVALTDTLLMVPSKSVSAIIGVKKGSQTQ